MKPEPMRALAVAALLVGPDLAAKELKKKWDRRKMFYPRPVVSGPRGRASLYDPDKLIAAAARAGYISAEQVEAAFRALRCIAAGGPASNAPASKPSKATRDHHG